MLITKFDLYKAEWLDLVFDHRNKEYGAYELRQHYGSNMVKSMGIAFAGIGVLIIASIVFKPKPGEVVVIKDFTTDVFHFKKLLPPVTPPAPQKAELKPAAPAKPSPATRFVTPVVVHHEPIEQPPVVTAIKGEVGPQTITGPATAPAVVDQPTTGTPGGSGGGVDTKVHDLGGLDVMPEPIGGASAWGKFLQKNLRYPAAAQEDGISGKVILSFIIERDGSLSNITVDGRAGHGFDEEALRVLKLAKAWSPGKQNGQAVRVKYSIPITFQLANNE